VSLCVTACRVQEKKSMWRTAKGPRHLAFGKPTNQGSSPSRSRRRRGAGTRTRMASAQWVGVLECRRLAGRVSCDVKLVTSRGPVPARGSARRAGGGAVPGARKNSGTESRLIVS
jgi:ribosomal protein L34